MARAEEHRMAARLLPYVAVALGVWLLVGDLQMLASGITSSDLARPIADLLLLYFGGQPLKLRGEAVPQ